MRELKLDIPKRVLLLGSGALQIGQAGEFDYSGSQAIKALKEEGVAVVLINPNIATVQTDPGFADATYYLPVQPEVVERLLEKEKCDAILLSFGGQTALNCGLALEEKGVLKRLGVRVLGTPVQAIRDTEDRQLFCDRLKEIGVTTAFSRAVTTVQSAVNAAQEIGFPVMVRSGFSLGGKGSKIVADAEECREIAEIALANAPQILVEECLVGWKEIEYEVVRDADDHTLTICNMENWDPMGIHTGESIVFAPAQTLDDADTQMLRDVALKTIRHLGILGECNIQYALDPHSREYRVIEVNARLSRSSALASKATGYPLAYVAAKIALGYRLPQIQNKITGVTTAYFEPALDYVVCKFPRWDLAKFEGSDLRIGSEMKSVGEVMSIGRTLNEALQKAIRMIETGADGYSPGLFSNATDLEIENALKFPTPERIFAVCAGLDRGWSVGRIYGLTKIDLYFLNEVAAAVELLRQNRSMEAAPFRELKRQGFSDRQLAKAWGESEKTVRLRRIASGVRPFLAQIDTVAAEYPAQTNFLYFTYSAIHSDVEAPVQPPILVLGSGCYRIGSSVEFDWCAVSAVRAAQALGRQVILLNCNPETVSTDFDLCERLVFDEISLETVLELVAQQGVESVLVSMGGQTPNRLALGLHREGIKLLGTSAEWVDKAEDRDQFSTLCDQIGVGQPKWAVAKKEHQIEETIRWLGGYPILVRPSYVLSGAAMRVAHSRVELDLYLAGATRVSPEHPVVMTQFELGAREIEFDAVARDGEVLLYALSEHIENAGVHSGDATLVFPPQRLSLDVWKEAIQSARKLVRALNVTGPVNIQMLAKHHDIRVIECNLRASRSFPFISKATGINFIEQAMRVVLGQQLTACQPDLFRMPYVAVKASMFSFGRIKGADPRLGVEMASTGEVGCLGMDTEEALLHALYSTGMRPPKKGLYFASERDWKFEIDLMIAQELGLEIFIAPELSERAKKAGIQVRTLLPHEFEVIFKSGRVDWVWSVPSLPGEKALESGTLSRRWAADLGVPLITDEWLGRRFLRALKRYRARPLAIRSHAEFLALGKTD